MGKHLAGISKPKPKSRLKLVQALGSRGNASANFNCYCINDIGCLSITTILDVIMGMCS